MENEHQQILLPTTKELKEQIYIIKRDKNEVMKNTQAMVLLDLVKNYGEILRRKEKKGSLTKVDTSDLYDHSIKGAQIMKVLAGGTDLTLNIQQNTIPLEEAMKFVNEYKRANKERTVDVGCEGTSDESDNSKPTP